MTGIITPDNVVQFRAIPYATLPGRFKQSILLETLSATNRDFTQPGFATPHTAGQDIFSGGPFPGQIIPTPMDEFKSLILQINVPLVCLQDGTSKLSKLPVMVYVHGGGFVLGKVDAQHNTAYMVEQSILDSQPVIGVSLQYRLGALGFMHTPDGGRNFGFYDQRNALLWIQKFIGGFGGNSAQVTAFGESAGGMSICYHMLAPPPPSGPLFKRVILMSGVIASTLTPAPIPEANSLYEKLVQAIGIEERGEAALEKLRGLEVQKIVDASSKISNEGDMWSFVEDETWFGKEKVTWDRISELIGRCEWIDEIMLGNTGFEGLMFTANVNALTPKNFSKSVSDQLGPKNASLIMDAYNITPDMDQNLFSNTAFRWIGDTVFDGPAHALSRHLTTKTTKKVYRYIFDIRNPFPNHPLYQQAHHWVDVYFVFKVHQFRYPTQFLKNISTKHAQLWIDFANGKTPWSEYKYDDGKEAVIMVADERDGWVERSVAEDERMNERSWKRCEVLWEAWKGVEGKQFSPLKIEPLAKAKMV